MPTGLLFDCDDVVAGWLFSYLQRPMFKFDKAIGLIDKNSNLVGAVLYQNWNGPNVEVSYYGKNTMTLGVLRCLARYTLATFDPARLTVITSKRNRSFMKALQKLGFRVEGAQRCYYGARDCNRNTGVRFVAFRDQVAKVAKIEETVQQCL